MLQYVYMTFKVTISPYTWLLVRIFLFPYCLCWWLTFNNHDDFSIELSFNNFLILWTTNAKCHTYWCYMYAYDNKLKLGLIQDAEKCLISLNSGDKNAVKTAIEVTPYQDNYIIYVFQFVTSHFSINNKNLFT